ncbi:MAG: DUF4340 domain-containing protein [Patescibacteria group bacterium]|nr:DUF4340 domain-containing protein [Patescibacteria group bacterium]
MKNWGRFLLPLIIILAAILAAQQIYHYKFETKASSGYNQATADFKTGDIDQIEIKDSQSNLKLNHNDAPWTVLDKPADEIKINQLLTAFFPKNNQYELVSGNPGKLSQFGLDSANVKTIVFHFKSGRSFTVLSGNYSTPGNFLKIDGDNRVYLSDQSLSSLISTDPQSYFNKRLLTLKSEDIKKISVSGPSTSYTLELTGGDWQMIGEKQKVNGDKINSFISSLTSLAADKLVLDQNIKNSYHGAAQAVEITETNNKTQTLKFTAGQSDYLIERSDGQLFTVSSPLVKDLVPSRTSLLSKTP